MKHFLKLLIASSLLILSANADIITDMTTAIKHTEFPSVKPVFDVQDLQVVCNSHTLYYVNDTTHRYYTIAISHNPETKNPFYCFTTKPVPVTLKGILTNTDALKYQITIFHKYEDLKVALSNKSLQIRQ